MTPVEFEVQAQSPQRCACRKQLLKARAHAIITAMQQKTHRTSIQRECELSDAARGRRWGCKHTINLSLVVAAPVLQDNLCHIRSSVMAGMASRNVCFEVAIATASHADDGPKPCSSTLTLSRALTWALALALTLDASKVVLTCEQYFELPRHGIHVPVGVANDAYVENRQLWASRVAQESRQAGHTVNLLGIT